MRSLWRWFKGAFWYTVVAIVAIVYFEYAPWDGLPLYLGVFVVAALLWVIISALRRRLRF